MPRRRCNPSPIRAGARAAALAGAALLLACGDEAPSPGGDRAPGPNGRATTDDSARAAFATETASLLLDTHVHELRGHLSVKARNRNRDDESPLVDLDVPHDSAPGPHTYLGVLHAELGALRTLLGDGLPVKVEEERVFVGRPELLVLGHRHGSALYVPVKLFARPYGAYVRVACPLANCATVWPRDILRFMRDSGYTGSAGVLEGYVEGLLDSVNVRALPTG